MALQGIQAAELSRINIGEIFGVARFPTFSTWGNSGIEPDKGIGN